MTSLSKRAAATILGAGLLLATPGVALAGDDNGRARTSWNQNDSGRDGVRTDGRGDGRGDFRGDTDRSGRRDGDMAGDRQGPKEAPARAQPEPTREQRLVEWWRTRCLEALDRRTAALGAAAERLAGVEALTDRHERKLLAIIESSTAGLAVIREKLVADDDQESLRSDCTAIFQDFRIFALVLPRTRLVVASDMAVALADRLDAVADQFESLIDDAEADGADMTEARDDLDAMRAEIASGKAAAQGIPASILGLAPADWNADHDVLKPAGATLRAARADLFEAGQLARKIRHGFDKDQRTSEKEARHDDRPKGETDEIRFERPKQKA